MLAHEVSFSWAAYALKCAMRVAYRGKLITLNPLVNRCWAERDRWVSWRRISDDREASSAVGTASTATAGSYRPITFTVYRIAQYPVVSVFLIRTNLVHVGSGNMSVRT